MAPVVIPGLASNEKAPFFIKPQCWIVIRTILTVIYLCTRYPVFINNLLIYTELQNSNCLHIYFDINLII
jgi:hypothetical protein